MDLFYKMSNHISRRNINRLKIPVGGIKLAHDVSSVSANAAICYGNVVEDGGLTITNRGFCFAETENPTIQNTIAESSVVDLGHFSCVLQGLKYYSGGHGCYGWYRHQGGVLAYNIRRTRDRGEGSYLGQYQGYV